MTTTTDYVVRRLRPDDEPAILRLLQAALAGGPTGERTAEFFRWKHLRNPFGASPGLVACTGEQGEQIVGVRLVLRWEFTTGGLTIRAVRPVDTATHPDHQGRGIFRRLTTRLVAELADEAELIFNTPNANSLPGYLRMGWHPVATLPVFIRPVDWLAFARGFRRAGGATGGPVAGPPGRAGAAHRARSAALPPAAHVFDDPRLTGLVEASNPEPDELRLHTRRTVEFLRWRYAEAPGLDYRAIVAESGGDLLGVAFARLRRRGPLTELTLSDLVTRAGDGAAARQLLRAARGTGCDHVATLTAPGTTARSATRATGFLSAPGVGMQLVARPLQPLVPDPLDARSWRLVLGDLEVF